MFPVPLRKEIIILLCLKAILIGVLYFALIGQAGDARVGREQVEAHLIQGN